MLLFDLLDFFLMLTAPDLCQSKRRVPGLEETWRVVLVANLWAPLCGVRLRHVVGRAVVIVAHKGLLAIVSFWLRMLVAFL